MQLDVMSIVMERNRISSNQVPSIVYFHFISVVVAEMIVICTLFMGKVSQQYDSAILKDCYKDFPSRKMDPSFLW